MNIKSLVFLAATVLAAHNTIPAEAQELNSQRGVIIAGAMKDVMWGGALEGIIRLDTIRNKAGLYGIGPESFLTGELLINNGRSFVSRIANDGTITLKETFNVSAPFFVYANVTNWKDISLPENILTMKDLEAFIDKQTMHNRRPFVFKLIGRIDSAHIHVQNLPEGTKVTSPKDAHQGQVNFILHNTNVEIVGFFSTRHRGIFTHHDTNVHMHLITHDKTAMGHLDDIVISPGRLNLFLPAE